MFPNTPTSPKAQPDPAESSEFEEAGTGCPYCGKTVYLQKGQVHNVLDNHPTRSKSNLAKVPMDQLKSVIKSGESA